MVGQLKKPSAGFEEVIKRHFYYKRDVINRTCDLWLADANDGASSKGHYAKLLKVVKDLRYLSFIPSNSRHILMVVYSIRDELSKLEAPTA